MPFELQFLSVRRKRLVFAAAALLFAGILVALAYYSALLSPPDVVGTYELQFQWKQGLTSAIVRRTSGAQVEDRRERVLILRIVERHLRRIIGRNPKPVSGGIKIEILGNTPYIVTVQGIRLEPDPTLLRHVAELEGPAELKHLLESGHFVDETNWPSSETALFAAVAADKPENVRLLLEEGAKPNARNSIGWTPIAEATAAEVVRLLITAGADPNIADESGLTPLMSAALNGNAEIVRILLQAGALPNIRARNGQTALAMALERGDKAVVAELRKAGAVQ